MKPKIIKRVVKGYIYTLKNAGRNETKEIVFVSRLPRMYIVSYTYRLIKETSEKANFKTIT